MAETASEGAGAIDGRREVTVDQVYEQLYALGDAKITHPDDAPFVYGLKIIGRLILGGLFLAILPTLIIWLVIFIASAVGAWMSSFGF
jgi:hypothetical protein